MCDSIESRCEAWARDQRYGNIVAVGSSYSSALVILLAAKHLQGLTAIASFSHGEYFDDKNMIKNAAARVAVPFYITTDPDEAANVTEALSKAMATTSTTTGRQPVCMASRRLSRLVIRTVTPPTWKASNTFWCRWHAN